MLLRYWIYILSLLPVILFSTPGLSQQSTIPRQLFGTIVKKGTTEVLPGVNVANLTLKKYNTSDLGGDYKIPAEPGDTLVFSSAGYLPDTLIVGVSMLPDGHVVSLRPFLKALPAVKIDQQANYELDSIQRREEYAYILDKKHPVVLMNEKRPGDGPGFSFSPLGYFSKKEKEKRKLKKLLKKEEEDYYIDSKFTPARVAQATRLPEDSLRMFMLQYRPSYHFCRIANNQDMLFYINDKLRIFRKDPLPIRD